jgi:hypothetical protein
VVDLPRSLTPLDEGAAPTNAALLIVALMTVPCLLIVPSSTSGDHIVAKTQGHRLLPIRDGPMLILVEGAADILVGVTTDVVLATAAVEAAAEASEDDVNPWRESMSEVFMVI